MNPSSVPTNALFRTWTPFDHVLDGRDGLVTDLPIPTRYHRDIGSVGVIANTRAHRNKRSGSIDRHAGSLVRHAAPLSQDELDATLADYARCGIGTLVIDGGDGTVRDVLSVAHRHFGDTMPALAIVPSGKTNALAIDLGVPADWTVDAAIDAVRHGRIVRRSPLEITRLGARAPHLRGFLFGAGAFVRATALAQETHRFGAFHGLAIALSIAGGVAQTLFGRRDNSWRRGESMVMELADGSRVDQPLYMLLGTTLERMPLGLRPFGRVRSGLKLLGIDAPPRRMAITVPALLAGSEASWLDRHGYHRVDTDHFHLRLGSSFILDGEVYDGGDLIVGRGVPLNFLVPAGSCS